MSGGCTGNASAELLLPLGWCGWFVEDGFLPPTPARRALSEKAQPQRGVGIPKILGLEGGGQPRGACLLESCGGVARSEETCARMRAWPYAPSSWHTRFLVATHLRTVPGLGMLAGPQISPPAHHGAGSSRWNPERPEGRPCPRSSPDCGPSRCLQSRNSRAPFPTAAGPWPQMSVLTKITLSLSPWGPGFLRARRGRGEARREGPVGGLGPRGAGATAAGAPGTAAGGFP